MPFKHLLNFLKLDPKATDLDLLINTSKIFYVPSGKISGQIPGSVEARIRFVREKIG